MRHGVRDRAVAGPCRSCGAGRSVHKEERSMSILSSKLRGRTKLPVTVIATALAVFVGTAWPAAAQESDGCPYGYFNSDGNCLPYSWNAPDPGADIGVFVRRGPRMHHDVQRDGGSGGGFRGESPHGGGRR